MKIFMVLLLFCNSAILHSMQDCVAVSGPNKNAFAEDDFIKAFCQDVRKNAGIILADVCARCANLGKEPATDVGRTINEKVEYYYEQACMRRYSRLTGLCDAFVIWHTNVKAVIREGFAAQAREVSLPPLMFGSSKIIDAYARFVIQPVYE